MQRRAFTLVELIAVMVVLGILAGVAAPKFFDKADDAREAAYASTLSSVQEGLRALIYANEIGVETGDVEFNQYGVPTHLGDSGIGEMTLFDDILEVPLRQAAPGTIGVKFLSQYTRPQYDFYIWDTDASDTLTLPADRLLIYIREPIGTVYVAGTMLELRFD